MSSGDSIFNWQELIDLANNLKSWSEVGSNEAINRSIISRSYYGAFCLARNLAKKNGWITLSNNGTDHDKVKRYYKDDKNKIKKQIGVVLERLHTDRKYADYEDFCCNSEQKAEVSINRALDVGAQLEHLVP